MHYMQTCPHCGQMWWDTHVCPKHSWTKQSYPFYPAVPNSPTAPAVKPEKIRREFSEEEIRAIIREEIASALSKFNMNSLIQIGASKKS